MNQSRERVTTHPISIADRPMHGAVPLDPWRASYSPRRESLGNLYVKGSHTRIERRLINSMVEGEWFKNVPQAHQLYDFMGVSLRDSQNRRVDMNGRIDLRNGLPVEDARMDHALDGTASPAELFTLLADVPELGSLELAKLSHPFDFDATNEMDKEIDELLLTVGGELLDDEPRYKVKRTDCTIPAAMLLRKQDLMDYRVDDGHVLRVVQRQGFMVFQGIGKEDELYFDRLIKNPKNHPALFAMTEGYIHDDLQHPSYGWVQPQATSYYAKYVASSMTQELK
jgi:hypothetical protein